MKNEDEGYNIETGVLYTTNPGDLSKDLGSDDELFFITIRNHLGNPTLRVCGTEKELIRIAGGAIVAALNKARGI